MDEVTMDCRQCDSVDTVEVPERSLLAYMEAGSASLDCENRVSADAAFPSLSVGDRELLIQARRKRHGQFNWYLCPTCWEAM